MPKLSRRIVARTIAAKLLESPKQRDHWMRVTAAYIVENNLVEDVDLLVNDIAQEIFDQSGKLFVDVTSARPLTDSIRSNLKAMLKDATQAHQVDLTEHIDKTLLGGLVARTPSAQLDLSVRTTIKQLATIK